MGSQVVYQNSKVTTTQSFQATSHQLLDPLREGHNLHLESNDAQECQAYFSVSFLVGIEVLCQQRSEHCWLIVTE